MAFHVIAKIKFEAKISVHPQAFTSYIDLDYPPWAESGDSYVKDEDVIRYTLTKTSDDEFVLVIEQIDLFGLELGKWTDKQYPKRQAILDSALKEIEETLGTKITVKEIKREIL